MSSFLSFLDQYRCGRSSQLRPLFGVLFPTALAQPVVTLFFDLHLHSSFRACYRLEIVSQYPTVDSESDRKGGVIFSLHGRVICFASSESCDPHRRFETFFFGIGPSIPSNLPPSSASMNVCGRTVWCVVHSFSLPRRRGMSLPDTPSRKTSRHIHRQFHPVRFFLQKRLTSLRSVTNSVLHLQIAR